MLSITFHDHETVVKKFPDYDADCIVEVSGNSKEADNLIDSLSESFSYFWRTYRKNKATYRIVVEDFSHFLDFVIEVNDYINKAKGVQEIEFYTGTP